MLNKLAPTGPRTREAAKARNLVMGERSRERELARDTGKPQDAAATIPSGRGGQA